MAAQRQAPCFGCTTPTTACQTATLSWPRLGEQTEARYRVSDSFGTVAFIDSGESELTSGEVNQINSQIQSQIATGGTSTTQCVVDNATLVSPDSVPNNTDIVTEYWKRAYVSAGVGVRLILGNYATLNLDYGYPLKDPASEMSGCESPSDALNASEKPTCITRIQDSSYLNINFKGAFHLGIGAQF